MLSKKIVILGTGGTIAGKADSALDNIGYSAAQLNVTQLVQSVAPLAPLVAAGKLLTEQVVQIDSKDMDFPVWIQLAERVNHFLAQDDVQGIVVTHGTDTLEETAYFLQAVLSPDKPVVLTCAMRPASALAPDGPQNIMDAFSVASDCAAHGVVVVCAGVIHSAMDVQKIHTYRLNAFGSGDTGPLGYVEEGKLNIVRNWPAAHTTRAQAAIKTIALMKRPGAWPRVEIVMNYVGGSGAVVAALVAQGIDGLVVAGTGNATLHKDLEAQLLEAQRLGVRVVRATRCVNGPVLSKADDAFVDSQGLTPVKARIALMLRLMTQTNA